MNPSIRQLTRNAIVAAMYVVLTLTPPLNAISFLAIQFRISEALLVLVWFRKEYAIGILIGTFFANVFGPLSGGFAFIDAILGTLVTLLALTWMQRIKLKGLGLLGPIVLNSIYLGLFLPFALGIPFTIIEVGGIALTVALGEAAVVFGLGLPLYWIISRQANLKNLMVK